MAGGGGAEADDDDDCPSILSTTVMVPIMAEPWTRQKYGNSPTWLKVRLKDSPRFRNSVSQSGVWLPGSPEVVVCRLPVIVHSTVSPTWIVMLSGLNFIPPVASTL